MTIEHGDIEPQDHEPVDPDGRGTHSIEGFLPVADGAARLAIVQIAPNPPNTVGDRGRVVFQTGGTTPGHYMADGAGGWIFLGLNDALKPPEAFTPSGTYPVTYDGGAVVKGDTFRMTAAGTMGAVTVNGEDLLISLVDAPGQVDANWMVIESNRDQATETTLGVAKLATQAEADAGTDDLSIITPLKLATAPVQSHALGGAAHAADTLANLNTKVSDATLDDSSAARPPTAHALGGAAHSADTLANLNTKVSDATLDDASDPRDPNAHAIGGAAHSADTLANLNTKVSDATLDGTTDTRTPVAATESVVGGGEIATQAEADAGTDDLRIVTPLKMANAPVNAHTIASHDTTATGAELDTLTDGSETGLHSHPDDVSATAQTTDATPTTVGTYTPGTNSRGIVIKGAFQAYEPATEDQAVFSYTLRAHRDASSVVTADNLHIDNGPDRTAGSAPWTLVADVSGGAIRFRFTGEAAHTIDCSNNASVRESV